MSNPQEWFQFLDPTAMREAHDASLMKGADEAYKFRTFVMEADREVLEILYSIVNSVTSNNLMGPMYLGIMTAVLDLRHGVSIVDGLTDEERLAAAGLAQDGPQ